MLPVLGGTAAQANVFARLPGAPPGTVRPLVLCGHLDTVPPGDGAWTRAAVRARGRRRAPLRPRRLGHEGRGRGDGRRRRRAWRRAGRRAAPARRPPAGLHLGRGDPLPRGAVLRRLRPAGRRRRAGHRRADGEPGGHRREGRHLAGDRAQRAHRRTARCPTWGPTPSPAWPRPCSRPDSGAGRPPPTPCAGRWTRRTTPSSAAPP